MQLILGRLGLMVLASGALFLSACGPDDPEAVPTSVYVMPVGRVPKAEIDAVGAEVRTFGLKPLPLAPIAIDASLWDVRRRQLVAEKASLRVSKEARARRVRSEFLILAVTRADLFSGADPGARFLFGYRSPSQTVTLISTARMDPRAFGEPANDALLAGRLRKYVARNLTYLFLGHDWSDDPTCITYWKVSSLDDLDALSPDRCPTRG